MLKGFLQAPLLNPDGSFSVTGASSVTAGDNYSLTVTAKNPDGSTNTSYVGTVHFTSTDPSATLPGDYTFLPGDMGVKTFPAIVFETAGARSVTVRDTVITSIVGKKNLTVDFAAVDHLLVEGFPDPYTYTDGLQPFTVTAKDAFNNTVTNYTGTVTTTSTSAAELPSPYTFLLSDNGSKTFDALLYDIGEQSINVTDGSVGGSQGGITCLQYDTLSLLSDGANDYADSDYTPLLDFNWNEPRSIAWYGYPTVRVFEVVAGQNQIDFTTMDGTFTAVVPGGDYNSPKVLAEAVQQAFEDANPARSFVCNFNQGDKKFRIECFDSVVFSILWNTGAHAPQDIAVTLGFGTITDSTGSSSYTGNGITWDRPLLTVWDNVDGSTLLGGWGVLCDPVDGSGDDTQIFPVLYIIEDYGTDKALGVQSDVEIPLNEWSSWVVTTDGSGTGAGVKMYRNGVLVSSTAFVETLTGANTQTNHPGWLAAVDNLNNYGRGYLDEIAIWDIELSPSEVADLYTPVGLPQDLNSLSTASNLVAWWRPEGESGGVVPDVAATGNNIDMTLRNGMTTDSEVPT